MKHVTWKQLLAAAIAVCLLALSGCAGITSGISGQTTTGKGTEGQEPSVTTSERVTGTAASTAADAEDDKVDITGDFLIETEDGNVLQSGNVWTISSAGEYTLTGVLSDGQVLVSAGEDDEVTLDLSGVSISCSTDSPIYVASAGKVKIKAVSDTYNEIADTRPLKTDENDTTGSAAIYALCDLNLVGSGSLVVTASYNNGVHTKDDLKIKNLTLKVTAPNHALKGNDSITVESGELLLISTAGDGVKTDNSDVSSKGNQRGTVTVSGGTVTIYSACDGIDAAYDVLISGDSTNLLIRTHKYSSYTVSSMLTTQSISGSGMGPGRYSSSSSVKSAESAKGIKADNAVTVDGGIITITCMDDGVHANSDVSLENGETPLGNVTVNGGSLTVTAADDGLHADGDLLITGGYVEVTEAHEGLEGHYITVEGGEIHVYATDDGVNATSISSGYGSSSNGLITVSGGRMFVEVGGNDVDGIDANGSYVQTGGFVLVSNPNSDSSGNMSAVDADGTVSVTGGVIVALGTVPGSGGMGGRGWNPFGGGGVGSSSLPTGYVTFSGTLSAGSHTFTYGSASESFTLRKAVSGGWIWASGISSSNYTLK